jgi:hypothetical protein
MPTIVEWTRAHTLDSSSHTSQLPSHVLLCRRQTVLALIDYFETLSQTLSDKHRS